jgi:RNase P subunit RPR2
LDIRCKNCQHIGPAAEVRPTTSGVELICANCGHANPLDVGATQGEESTRPASASTASPAEARPKRVEPSLAAAPAEAASVGGFRKSGEIDIDRARAFANAEKARNRQSEASYIEEISEKMMERLIPEQGEGARCRKCAHLLDPSDTNCRRCGLDIAESHRYAEGDAPWERPPKGQEAAFEQAMLLWASVSEQWSEERLDNFAAFVREEKLYELGIRLLRFRLAEHPEDRRAVAHLQELVSMMQSRVVVARAQAEASAQQFGEGVAKTRAAIVGATVIFWIGIFLLFLFIFMNNCG